MLYLKIFFLLTYFIIIFIFLRFSSSLQEGKFTIYGYDLFSSLSSVFESYFGINKANDNVPVQKTNHETLEVGETIENYYNEIKESNLPGNFASETNLLGYEDFIEKVEDTKASVWVIRIYPPNKDDAPSETKGLEEWLSHSKRLKNYGIKTGTYQCMRDIRLCLIHKITSPAILLTMPKGSHPKGNVAFHLFYPKTANVPLFTWIRKKLYLKVRMVHSISELKEGPVRRQHSMRQFMDPSLFFVYKSKALNPPLLLSALSVRFTGRIKFVMLKTNDKDKEGADSLIALNRVSKYSYGKHKGENFTYSCMELFLKTLHPEVNDIFIASLILLNMACWFEVSFQKGGPLRRILFYVWGFATSNILLVTIWLPLLKLIYLPQVQPLVEVCLQNLQKIMFTNFAAIIRQDFMEISKHVYFVVFGFLCYGILLGYLHFRFRNGSDWASNTSISEIFEHDIDDIQNLFQSILTNITPTFTIYRFEARIERILNTLSTSQLWLPTDNYAEYLKDLSSWKHCSYLYSSPVEEVAENQSLSVDAKQSPSLKTSIPATKHCTKHCSTPVIPDYVFKVHNCVICLEDYKCQNLIIGLPCGHSFHQNCAYGWLMLEEAQNKCPVCRWPCNIKKGIKIEVIDTIE